jgi:hypothetical protein
VLLPVAGVPLIEYTLAWLKTWAALYGYLLKPEEYLIDIGTLEKYNEANEDRGL